MKDEGAEENRAKHYFNCSNTPLLYGPANRKTLALCPPPALHITLGLVNAIYKRIEAEDSDTAQKWVKISACQRHSNFGFTGRDCHKLLKNRSVIPAESRIGYLRTVLERFQEVFEACFQEELELDYAKKLMILHKAG